MQLTRMLMEWMCLYCQIQIATLRYDALMDFFQVGGLGRGEFRSR
jgi:hypothetical protein